MYLIKKRPFEVEDIRFSKIHFETFLYLYTFEEFLNLIIKTSFTESKSTASIEVDLTHTNFKIQNTTFYNIYFLKIYKIIF